MFQKPLRFLLWTIVFLFHGSILVRKKYCQISSLIRENQVIFTSRSYVIPKHRCDLKFRLKMTASAYHLKILKFFNAGPVISSKWKIQLDILLINVYSHVAAFFRLVYFINSQSIFTCSKTKMKTPEQRVKFVQSQQ